MLACIVYECVVKRLCRDMSVQLSMCMYMYIRIHDYISTESMCIYTHFMSYFLYPHIGVNVSLYVH